MTLSRDTAQSRIVAERELTRQRVTALEENLTDARETVDSLNLRVARLAIVLHRIWLEKADFQWSITATTAA